MRVFLDMDCVLSDFVGAVAEWYGIDKAEFERQWERGRYGFGHTLIKFAIEGENVYGNDTITRFTSPQEAETDFWTGIQGNSEFWSEMGALPWSAELIAAARSYDLNYRYLTSPSDCGYCLVGKHQWLYNNVGANEPRRMIPTGYKYELAQPGRLLIDDHDANVDAWVKHGGKAILFPALHNRRHAEAGDAWETVQLELKTLMEGPAT